MYLRACIQALVLKQPHPLFMGPIEQSLLHRNHGSALLLVQDPRPAANSNAQQRHAFHALYLDCGTFTGAVHTHVDSAKVQWCYTPAKSSAAPTWVSTEKRCCWCSVVGPPLIPQECPAVLIASAVQPSAWTQQQVADLTRLRHISAEQMSAHVRLLMRSNKCLLHVSSRRQHP